MQRLSTNMSAEKALAMEEVNPEILEDVSKLYKGRYMSHGLWGPMKCYLPENYKILAEAIYRMPVRPDDVFVVTFPRSGTTWTQELVWLVANDIDIEKAKSIPLVNRYVFLEQTMFVDATQMENMKQHLKTENPNARLSDFDVITVPGPELMKREKSPRFVKTHLPLSLLPPNLLKETKVVYVARDPRDVAVSYYHFSKGIKTSEYIGDLKQFVDLFTRGLLGWTPFLDHIKEAWRLRHNSNLLFLFYEDMCKDIHGCIKQVSEFLGKKYTYEQIAQIAEHIRFDNFKMNEAVDGGRVLKDVGVFKKDSEFVRKGKAGGWRELFDAETIEKINTWMTENLKDTDLVFSNKQ